MLCAARGLARAGGSALRRIGRAASRFGGGPSKVGPVPAGLCQECCEEEPRPGLKQPSSASDARARSVADAAPAGFALDAGAAGKASARREAARVEEAAAMGTETMKIGLVEWKMGQAGADDHVLGSGREERSVDEIVGKAFEEFGFGACRWDADIVAIHLAELSLDSGRRQATVATVVAKMARLGFGTVVAPKKNMTPEGSATGMKYGTALLIFQKIGTLPGGDLPEIALPGTMPEAPPQSEYSITASARGGVAVLRRGDGVQVRVFALSIAHAARETVTVALLGTNLPAPEWQRIDVLSGGRARALERSTMGSFDGLGEEAPGKTVQGLLEELKADAEPDALLMWGDINYRLDAASMGEAMRRDGVNVAFEDTDEKGKSDFPVRKITEEGQAWIAEKLTTNEGRRYLLDNFDSLSGPDAVKTPTARQLKDLGLDFPVPRDVPFPTYKRNHMVPFAAQGMPTTAETLKSIYFTHPHQRNNSFLPKDELNATQGTETEPKYMLQLGWLDRPGCRLKSSDLRTSTIPRARLDKYVTADSIGVSDHAAVFMGMTLEVRKRSIDPG